MVSAEELRDAAARGESETVSEILKTGDVDIDAGDAQGNAALHLAVLNGYPDISTLLLDAGADVDLQNALGETALLLAARLGDLESVQVLLSYGADKRIKDANGRTPFFVAMSATHSEVAAELLPGESPTISDVAESGSFFGTTEAEGRGASTTSAEKRLEIATREDQQHLRDAAEAGDIVSVKEILELAPEIDIDATDDQSHTALYRAVFYGRTQVVEYLLKQGADADLSDTDGKTPLHVAAARGYGKIMSLLVENAKKIDAQDLKGATPFFTAAEAGSSDVLKALLDAGADPNIPNSNEETPLWAATANGHSSFVRILLEESEKQGYKIEVDSPGVLRGRTPLHLAAERGDTQMAGLLLDAGASKDLRDSSGCTALFIAADMGRTRMVGFLLEHGAALDAVNHHGETALYVAALDGHVPVTKELLSRGADTEIADDHGQTPLMGAAQEGHTAIISELLRASARVEAANNIGETPLMIAALEGYQNAAALLIENGADIDTARNDGKTAMHLAAMDGHVGVVNVLLAAAKTELEELLSNSSRTRLFTSPLHLATDTQGETALHLAARFRQVSVMRLLLDYDVFFHDSMMGSTIFGRLLDVQNKFGWNALHVAVDRAHHGAVQLLLEHQAQVNAADIFGNTPIHLAARGVDHRILLKLLSEKGAQRGAVNVEGRTPLHFAAACVRPSSVTFLLNDGADVLAADVDKQHPIDVLGNVDICNPPQALEEGLCEPETHRLDMCPITLGTKNALVETKVLLQVASKDGNIDQPCLEPCTPRGLPVDPQPPLSADSASQSDSRDSVSVPVYGLLIPVVLLLLLVTLGLVWFWRHRWKRHGDAPTAGCAFQFSKRRLKQKQHQADLDRMESAMQASHHVHRKNTFDVVRSILAEPSSKHDSRMSQSSDTGSSCGWSDTSEQSPDKKAVLDLPGCSSGEHSGEWNAPRISAAVHDDPSERDLISKLTMWSPPMRMGSVPRIRPRDIPPHSFCIRMKKDPEPNNTNSEPLPSPERVSSAPLV